ncbi:MAG: ATP-binding cassette domain-containing protein [Clostridia bacterium]|nr:ATP-binding cassette domain-containing protein [Clostridia bacterium]
MLEIIDVVKTYVTRSGNTNALNGLSVTFPDSGLVFVTGKSGCGKTTLLNCVGGLDGFDGGDMIIDGKKFSEFSTKDYDSYRNTFIGFIFQEYNLLPEYTIEKNIQIANELQGIKASKETIDEILKLVDLEGLNLRKPSELSGGQKQRVAIARALIKNPKIIMADEPTGALDSVTGIQVMETLKKLSKDKLIIIVSHDLELAERYADRIIRLVDGQLVEDVTLTETEIVSNLSEANDNLIVKLGAELDKNETETLIKAIREKKNISFTDKISSKEKVPTAKITVVHPEHPVKFVNSKMKYKSAAGLGVRSLGVKPFRLAMTILLSVISFALFGVFDTIGAYDDTRAIANLIKSDTYPSITLISNYVNDDQYSYVRITDQTIKQLNSVTHQDFRPLYEFNDRSVNGISNGATIKDLEPASGRAPIKTGSEYYYNYVEDFIEFGKDEISGNVIDKNGFNYKIVKGRYPNSPSEMVNDLGEPITNITKFSEVAISSYLADSIFYWINTYATAGTVPNVSGKPITKVDDLIGAKININNSYYEEINGVSTPIQYTITGIIDCGEIPKKFDSLKDSFPNASTYVLANDLATIIHSSAYLKLFVAEGYVDAWREYNNRQTVYFAGGNDYSVVYTGIKTDKETLSLTSNNVTAFYNYTKDYKANGFEEITDTQTSAITKNRNIYFFDGSVDRTLKNDEVLITPDMWEDLYAKEIRESGNTSTPISNKRGMIDTLNSNEYSQYTKQDTVSNIARALGSNVNKTIKIRRKDLNSNKSFDHTFKVVGLYTNVNYDIHKVERGVYYNHPLMLTEKALESLGVCTDQGEYARIISPLNSSYFAANALAKTMTGNSGIIYGWYNNSMLSTINENRGSLQQLSNLFFIVAILLAVFSIFMLFNYISTSILSKRNSIGVLRALGSNGRDIFRMFFTESFIISLINGGLACGAAAIGCIFVNSYIRNIMNMTINFAIFGIRQAVIIVAISILTGIVSSLIPILRISKEKPVDLIRKN